MITNPNSGGQRRCDHQSQGEQLSKMEKFTVNPKRKGRKTASRTAWSPILHTKTNPAQIGSRGTDQIDLKQIKVRSDPKTNDLKQLKSKSDQKTDQLLTPRGRGRGRKKKRPKSGRREHQSSKPDPPKTEGQERDQNKVRFNQKRKRWPTHAQQGHTREKQPRGKGRVHITHRMPGL